MRKFLLLLALTTIFPGSALRGQATIEMPDGRPVPASLLLDPGTRKPQRAWVAAEDCRPRQAWHETAPANPGVRTRFMQPFFVAAKHKDPKTAKEYLLLAEADAGAGAGGKPIGWVNEEIVVLRQDALTEVETKVARKVLIVTRPETLRMAAPAFDARHAGLLARPDDSARVRVSFPLYKILFVFAETDRFFLVGSGPAFSPQVGVPTSADKVVEGWLPKTRPLAWNTRLALQWDRVSTLPDAVPRRASPALFGGRKQPPGNGWRKPEGETTLRRANVPRRSCFVKRLDKTGCPSRLRRATFASRSCRGRRSIRPLATSCSGLRSLDESAACPPQTPGWKRTWNSAAKGSFGRTRPDVRRYPRFGRRCC